MKHILILVDYHGYFYSSATRKLFTMDVNKIKRMFSEKGFLVDVKNFCEIDLRNVDYSGVYVLYTSQEDPDLKYKDFIEDIILGLKEKGAILVPEFKYFRAHHNKVFMEILRDVSSLEEIKNIKSRCFGTFEEYDVFGKNVILPAVLKPSAGAVSTGVSLINEKNCRSSVKKISSSFFLLDAVKNFAKWLLRHPRPPRSLHRNKFLIQNLVKGLNGDYKVLIYGRKFYVLKRENRPGDFRASGSGRLSYPENINSGLLNFAQKVFDQMTVPFISLDIGEKDGQYFLIEFQLLMFGNYTIERSAFYFSKENGSWNKIIDKSDLETEFVLSVSEFINKINK